MQTTFSEIKRQSGSTRKSIEVSRGKHPFGSMWTWPNTKIEQHPWHVRTLTGEHKIFWGKGGLKTAKNYINNL
jgi:hypothetical protein